MKRKVIESGRPTVESKYLVSSKSMGCRVKASTLNYSVTLPWDYELLSSENHAIAIEALLNELDWEGQYIIGATKAGYVAVFKPGSW